MEGVGSIEEVRSQPVSTVITPMQTQKMSEQCVNALTKSHKRWGGGEGEGTHLTEASIEVDIFLELEFQVVSFYSCIPRA